jgi:hypothetical protein
VNGAETPPVKPDLARRHLTFGWWCLLLFLALGLVLEGLLGFKVPMYVDLSNETRRLLWRLAHAHGTVLALVNIAWGLTQRAVLGPDSPPPATASRCLLCATLMLPLGFFLGGLAIHGGDPGNGVLFVPVGGLVLLIAVLLMAWTVARSGR